MDAYGKVSVHFLHACFFAVRTRSVLTDKFSGGGRDVVSSRALRRGFLAGGTPGQGSKVSSLRERIATPPQIGVKTRTQQPGAVELLRARRPKANPDST